MDVVKLAVWLLVGCGGTLVAVTLWYSLWGTQIATNEKEIKRVETKSDKLETRIDTKVDPVVALARLELTQAQSELKQLHIDMISADQRLNAAKGANDALVADAIKMRLEMTAADSDLKNKIAVLEERLRGAIEGQQPLPFTPPRRSR